MSALDLDATLNAAGFTKAAGRLYGALADAPQARFGSIADHFERAFKNRKASFFSSPGRAEITGNHTDHNGGLVLAASITVDIVAAAAPSGTDTVTLYSEQFPEPFIVNLRSLDKRSEERGTSALIRGLAAGFEIRGYKVGGLNVTLSSNVMFASGLSSSAALEMLIATMFNDFFNGGSIDTATMAQIGRFAENEYWNKPSGLLDQMACGTGGLVLLDFSDPGVPKVERIDFNFSKESFRLLMVNTGGNHADLTDQYAAIPQEMWSVARAFGKERLIELPEKEFWRGIQKARESAGDRAVLRAIHFYDENRRVRRQREALTSGDFSQFVRCINESGSSSWRLLQNTAVPTDPAHQEIQLALALTQRFFGEKRIEGACRVHGGGFAGTILVALPDACLEEYLDSISPLFKREQVTALDVRPLGAVNVSKLAAAA